MRRVICSMAAVAVILCLIATFTGEIASAAASGGSAGTVLRSSRVIDEESYAAGRETLPPVAVSPEMAARGTSAGASAPVTDRAEAAGVLVIGLILAVVFVGAGQCGQERR